MMMMHSLRQQLFEDNIQLLMNSSLDISLSSNPLCSCCCCCCGDDDNNVDDNDGAQLLMLLIIVVVVESKFYPVLVRYPYGQQLTRSSSSSSSSSGCFLITWSKQQLIFCSQSCCGSDTVCL